MAQNLFAAGFQDAVGSTHTVYAPPAGAIALNEIEVVVIFLQAIAAGQVSCNLAIQTTGGQNIAFLTPISFPGAAGNVPVGISGTLRRVFSSPLMFNRTLGVQVVSSGFTNLANVLYYIMGSGFLLP
jgi:hypothetical protein